MYVVKSKLRGSGALMPSLDLSRDLYYREVVSVQRSESIAKELLGLNQEITEVVSVQRSKSIAMGLIKKGERSNFASKKRNVPALHHERVNPFRTSWRGSQADAFINEGQSLKNKLGNSYISTNYVAYLIVSMAFKWLVSQTPYLVHDHSKTPHITSTGVLPEMQGLQCI